jgi:hypothetical protein
MALPWRVLQVESLLEPPRPFSYHSMSAPRWYSTRLAVASGVTGFEIVS